MIVVSWQPLSLGFILSTEFNAPSAYSVSVLDRIRVEITSAGAHKIIDTGPTSFRFKRKFPGWTMSPLNVVDRGEVRAENRGSYTLVSVSTGFLRWLIGGVIFATFAAIQGLPLGFAVGIVALVIVFNGVSAYFALRNLLARSTQAHGVRAA